MKALLISVMASLSMAAALAAPPAAGDYAKDPATTTVADRTTSSIRTLNMFLCVFAKAVPSEMVSPSAFSFRTCRL